MKHKLSLRGRGLQLLAQREHSRLELRRKLMRYALADIKARTEAALQDERSALRVGVSSSSSAPPADGAEACDFAEEGRCQVDAGAGMSGGRGGRDEGEGPAGLTGRSTSATGLRVMNAMAASGLTGLVKLAEPRTVPVASGGAELGACSRGMMSPTVEPVPAGSCPKPAAKLPHGVSVTQVPPAAHDGSTGVSFARARAGRMASGDVASSGDQAKAEPVSRAEPWDDGPEASTAAEQVEAVLDWLQARGYLSEERFVESRLHARASRFGNQRIRQELAQHGVRLTSAETQSLKDSELARARAVWSRKFGHQPVDAAEKARQMRFLAGRGFSSEVVRRVVQAGEDE